MAGGNDARIPAGLPADARAALEEVVSANLRGVVGALEAAPLDEPVFAICLGYGPTDEFQLDVAEVAVGLRSDREGASALQGYDAFRRAFNPVYYSGPVLDPDPPPVEHPGFEDAERRLADALSEAGCPDRARVVLNEVARRLTAAPPAALVADDVLVAFIPDDQFDEELYDNVVVAAGPDVARALQELGLLPAAWGGAA